MRKLCTLFPFYSGWSPIITFILMISCALGQGYDVIGRAFDEQGKKIGPVRLVLYDQDKKKVIEVETPNSGKFKLKNIPDGKYTLNIYGPDGYGITENINLTSLDSSVISVFPLTSAKAYPLLPKTLTKNSSIPVI